jgi:hypothetical protein
MIEIGSSGCDRLGRALAPTDGVSLRDVELIEAASAEFERVVRQLPADAWDRPTPSEISVREVIEHVVVGNRFTALLLAGVDRDHAQDMLTGDQLGADPVGCRGRLGATSSSGLRGDSERAAGVRPEGRGPRRRLPPISSR